MNVGSVVQIGGAVKHSPLHSLYNFVHTNNEDNEEDPHCESEMEKSVIGGFIGEGYLAWRAAGATIEVIDSQTCIQQAAWTFGAMLHYTSPVITCVCGIGVGPVTHIVIGVDLGVEENMQGMVGVLSLRRSRLIRAFRFQYKVTNVCMITGGEKVVDPSTLTPELRSCQGLLAVATSNSSLYLVDLALDLGDEITSDEMAPARLIEISIPDPHAELERNKIVSSHSHPILCLSDNMHVGKMFRLLGPDDQILYDAPNHSVNITSLMYIPQLASLVVGYSFGSFQLINLNLITIDCASPYEENIPPVFSFAYQEPENDPRSCVYLWVCRSHSSESDCHSENYSLEKSTCSLYSMHYEKKEWIEGHGLWYQSLLSVSSRFNFSAIGGIGEKIFNSSPSKMISAMSILGTTPSSNLPTSLNGMTDDALSLSDEEADPVPELSLCLFCWEANVLCQGKVVAQHYIAIFDINQWYQAQMPSHLRLEENELCAYMSFHILDKVPSSFSEVLLGGMPLRGSWSRHNSRTHSEKMWYPSALSYDFNLLTSESLATYHCPSVQQSTISCLLQQGPGAVVNPNAAFKMCVFSGILSNIDAVLNGGSSMVNEREYILNTALEYHLLPLLSQCVVEFSEGRFSHLGCSPQLLLDWGWNKLKEIKNLTDLLCGQILTFPCEGIVSLSTQNLISLHQNLTYLSHLSLVFTQIRDNSGEITTLSAGELEGRVQVVNLLKLQLQIILWFYHCGLLPQYSPEEVIEETAVPFPSYALRNKYEKRRKEMKDLTGSGSLLIDSIMSECGKLLPEVWNVEKGKECHLYPPSSLHNIIFMYIIPGIPAYTKHRIVQYLFLDLTSILSETFSSVLEELVKFPSSFSLSPSLIKLTQAFWLIDNKDFQAGLLVLLDPLVNPVDINQEQHHQIIKTLLYQGHEEQALTYIQIRKPPISQLDDIRLNLTVLLANGRIREAFHFQRTHRVMSNAKQLLHHFFLGCEELERLESIVHLPLSPEEEESFVSYLRLSHYSSAQDILLIYYLQKSRYTEITPFLGPKHKNSVTHVSNSKQNTRSAIVQGFISHLPDVRSHLNVVPKEKPSRKIYLKPKPLSAHIRQASSALKTPKSKSTSIRSSLNLVSSSSECSFPPYTPFRSKAQRRKAITLWNEDMGLEKNCRSRDETQIRESTGTVFPSYSKGSEFISRLSSPNTLNPPQIETSVSKTNHDKEITILQESVAKLMESILRKELCLPQLSTVDNTMKTSLGNLSISQDVVSLLKTPVKHQNRVGTDLSFSSLAETPHSILKVRKILEETKIVNEKDSSPIVSFPLRRMSMKKESAKKIDITAENHSLTPKQLRFDLSATHALSLEEEEEEEELTLLRSLQKKRKREESPSLESVSEVPSRRKPLPRFVNNEEAVELEFGLTCSDVDEKNNNSRNTNSEIELFPNYICSNENKPLQEEEEEETLQITGSKQNKAKVTCELNEVNYVNESSHKQNLNSSEESFHSVVDIQEEIMTLDEENMQNLQTKEIASTEDERENIQSYSSSPLCDNININNELAETPTSDLSVNREYKYFPEHRNNSMEKVEIHTSNITVTTTKIVKETVLLSSQKESTRYNEFDSQNAASEESDFYFNEKPINSNISSSETTTIENVSGSSNTVLTNSNSLVNKCYEFYQEIDGIEEKLTDPLENIELRNLEERDSENRTSIEPFIGFNCKDSLKKNLDSDKNESLDEIYVLKFSDSEDESSNFVHSAFDKNCGNTSSVISKQDTLPISSTNILTSLVRDISDSFSKSIAKCDTVVLNTDKVSDLGKENITEQSISNSLKTLPSDLESAQPLRLTTKEREIVDRMLKDQSLSLNHISSVIGTKDSALNKSLAPALEFPLEESVTKKEKENKDLNLLVPALEFPIEESMTKKEKENKDLNPLVPALEFPIEESMTKKEKENKELNPNLSCKLVDPASSQVSLQKFDVAVSEDELAEKMNAADVLNEEIVEKLNVKVSKDEIVEKLNVDVFKDEIVEKLNASIVNNYEYNKEISPQGNIDSIDSFNGNSQKLEVSEIPGYLYIETNPDNNNIQKDSPLSKDIKLISSPSRRRSRHLSGLNPEAIINKETPCTPLRRSLRLSHNTPSKIDTPDLRHKNNSEVSEVGENNVSTSRGRRRRSSISNASDDLESVKVNFEMVITPNRRRRSSLLSETEESSKVLRTPNSKIRKQKNSNTSKAEEILSEISFDAAADSDTRITTINLPERLYRCSSEENEIDNMKEPLFVIQDENSQLNENANTPMKHVDTPRRRSARLSGLKEVLGTIVEDTVETETPRKSVTNKSTPRKQTSRSKRKSISLNSSIIEPILETIKEDSEASENFSLQTESKILFPSLPLTSSNSPASLKEFGTQLGLENLNNSPDKNIESPVQKENTEVERHMSKDCVSGTPELWKSQVYSSFKDNNANLAAVGDALISSSEDKCIAINSNNTPQTTIKSSISVNGSGSDFALPDTRSKEVSESSCIGKLENGPQEENFKKFENLPENNEYVLIPPEENSRSFFLKSYSEKKTNSGLNNSKQLRASWRRSRTSLSLPQCFEFPKGISSNDLGFYKKRENSVSPIPLSQSFISNDDVFISEENKKLEGSVANNIHDEIKEHSPSPVYHLFKENSDVVILPKKPPKLYYRRRLTSLKSYNSDNITGRKDEDKDKNDNRPSKKIRSSSWSTNLPEKIISKSTLKNDEKEEIQLKGFLFQNPEIISAKEAVSEVFEKLTKEHERIVSENFVFSPPFSLSEKRKKRRKCRRNLQK